MRGRVRSTLAVAATALALAALAGCGSDDGGAAVTSTPDQATTTAAATSGTQPPADAPLLGVLDATAGTWDGDALTLTGVRPDAIWFTDRPARQAGTTPIDDFLPLFFTGDDPPNAALQLTGADERADVAIVELTDPQWDADTGELTLTATPIDPDDALATTHPGLANQLDRADDTLPTTFGPAVLFIDTGGAAGDVLTPVAVPGAAEVEQLATEYGSVVDDMITVSEGQRARIEQDPTTCGRNFLDFVVGVIDDERNVLDDVVAPLEAAVADGQDLPTSDLDQWQQAQADLENARLSLSEMQELYDTGGCLEN